MVSYVLDNLMPPVSKLVRIGLRLTDARLAGAVEVGVSFDLPRAVGRWLRVGGLLGLHCFLEIYFVLCWLQHVALDAARR